MLLEQIWLEMPASWPSAFPGGGDRIRRPPPYVDPPPLAASLWYQWTLIFNSGFVGYPCIWPFRRCLNFRWDPVDMLYNSWGDIQVSMGSRAVNSLVGTYNRGSSMAPTTLGTTMRRGGIHRVRSDESHTDDVPSSWGDRSADSLIVIYENVDVAGLYSDDVESVASSSPTSAIMLTP